MGGKAAPLGVHPTLFWFTRRSPGISIWPGGQKYLKTKGKCSSKTLKQESQPMKTHDRVRGRSYTIDRQVKG